MAARPYDGSRTRTNDLPCPLVQKMLRNSCAIGHERRNHCAFKPMPMRRAPLNGVLSAEEYVGLTPKPGKASLGESASSEESCIRKAVSGRGFDSSPVGLADTTAEDEAATGTAFALMEIE
jgi:hypothetical protein